MGRRCHDQRLAKGPDAAAGHQLQRALAARARSLEEREVAALVLGLGRDRRDEPWRLLALHAQHQPALRLERGPGHAARRRPGERVRQAPALGRGRARGRHRLGFADPVRRRCGVLAGTHGRDHAGGYRCRCGAPADPRALRFIARHGPGQIERPHVPHGASGRQQRPDLGGDGGRRRDGFEARGREARRQRCASDDESLRECAHPRSGFAAPPRGGTASGRAKPDPRRSRDDCKTARSRS